MRIPVFGLEKDGEEGSAAKDRMERETFEKAVEGMSAAGHEVGAKSVTANIFECVLVRERGNGALGVIFEK